MRAWRLVVLCLASILMCASAQAAGVLLGPFCIEGVTLVQDEAQKTVTADGYWIPVKLAFKKPNGAPSKARMNLFDRPLPKFAGLPTCKEAIAEAKKNGTNLIFSGTIDRLELAADLFLAASGNNNQLQIAPGKFVADLGAIDAGSQRLDGGTIDLKGGKLSIANPTKFLGGASLVAGLFQLTLPARTVTNMRLVLPGGTEWRTTFTQVTPGETLAVRINMATREADLWAGTLRGTSAASAGGPSATIGGLTLVKPEFKAASVELTAKDGSIAAKLNNVRGKADKIVWKRKTIALALTHPTFEWKGVTGSGKSGTGRFDLSLPNISDAQIKSPTAGLGPEGQADLLAGAVQASFALLSEKQIDGKLSWTSPQAPAVRFFIPQGALKAASLAISGSPDAPKLDGSFDVDQIVLGGMSLRRAFSFKFHNPTLALGLRIPIKFDVHDQAGQFTLSDRDQKALITAGLRRAFLDAVLVVDLADLKKSHLDVPAGKFELALFGMAATQPFVAGTVPAFGDVEVGVKNPGPLRVGAASSGVAVIVSSALVLGEPIIRVGEKGSEARAGLKLEALGGATFSHDLATGVFALTKAEFEAKNVDFRLLDHGAKIDLAGIQITDPEFKLEHLKIAWNQETPAKTGTAQGVNLSFNGSRIEKPRDPERPKEIVFQAAFTRPLAVKQFAALRVHIDKVLAFEAVEIKQFDVGMNGTNAEFGDGFRIVNASLSLAADALAAVEVNEAQLELYDNARFAALGTFDAGSSLHLNNNPAFDVRLVVSGYSNNLGGSGSATIGAFTGSHQAHAEIDMPCDDGQKLKVPLEYNFGSAGLTAAVAVSNGEFAAAAGLGPLFLAVHTKSGSHCNGKRHKHVLIEGHSIEVHGPVPIPCIKHGLPALCDDIKIEVIPEVSFTYYFKFEVLFAGGGILLSDTAIVLGNPNTRVCNVGLIDASHLLIVPNFAPQIETEPSPPGANDVAKLLLQAAFAVPETLTLTSVASGAGWLVGSILTGLGKVGCLI